MLTLWISSESLTKSIQYEHEQMHRHIYRKIGEANSNDEETNAVHDEASGVVVLSFKADVWT